jgi:hypothetical protein
MSTRYLIIAMAATLCAGALLYAVDHQAFIPRGPHSVSISSTK